MSPFRQISRRSWRNSVTNTSPEVRKGHEESLQFRLPFEEKRDDEETDAGTRKRGRKRAGEGIGPRPLPRSPTPFPSLWEGYTRRGIPTPMLHRFAVTFQCRIHRKRALHSGWLRET